VVVLFLISLCGVSDARGENPTDQPADEQTQRAIALEKEVLAYRQAIRTIRADVTITSSTNSSGNDIRDWKAWAKGDRLRVDQKKGAIEAPHVVIKGNDYIYSRGFGQNEVTKELELSITSAYRLSWKGAPLFDLRMLGAVPVTTTSLPSVTEWEHPLAKANRTRSTIKSTRLDGVDADLTLITTSDQQGDGQIKLWIDPRKGPSLIRCERRLKTSRGTYLDIYESQLEQFGDVWFPTRTSCRHYKNWFPVPISSEITTLSNVEINQEIDDEVFSLPAMMVEPGDAVSTPEGMAIWDGEKLISSEQIKKFRRREFQKESDRSR
jgi:hypothetical protein